MNTNTRRSFTSEDERLVDVVCELIYRLDLVKIHDLNKITFETMHRRELHDFAEDHRYF